MGGRVRPKPMPDLHLYDTDIGYRSLPEWQRLTLTIGEHFRYHHPSLRLVYMYEVCLRPMTEDEKVLHADKQTRDYVYLCRLADSIGGDMLCARRAIIMPSRQGDRVCCTGEHVYFNRRDTGIDPVDPHGPDGTLIGRQSYSRGVKPKPIAKSLFADE